MENESTPSKPCLMCEKTPGLECDGCDNVYYCCVECQHADYPIHRVICKAFGNFDTTTRPSKDHYLGVLFSESKCAPTLVWIDCPYEPLVEEHIIQYEDYLGGEMYPGKMMQFENDVTLNRRLKTTVGVVHHAAPNPNDSPINAAIFNLKVFSNSGDEYTWFGPVLGFATSNKSLTDLAFRPRDIDLYDFRYLVDCIAAHDSDLPMSIPNNEAPNLEISNLWFELGTRPAMTTIESNEIREIS
ncbi:hypothetical protein F5Y16DRAFT_401464 [Xylariaceae sp. FL0255]|nr:hypothetical protein F5Y16DRAFT_401464 [Xylariaceae sp. FL0255]